VPGIDANSGWSNTGWRQNDIVNAPLLSGANIVALSIRDDMSFTAQYETGTYTATFNLNGAAGTPPPSQTVDFGETLTEPTPAPSQENNNFLGWNINQDGSGTNWDFATSTMPSNNITLYAQWQTMTRTVTFNPNGGQIAGSNTRAVPHGGDIASLAAPNDTLPSVSFDVAVTPGWNFVHWRTAIPTAANNTPGNIFDASTSVIANKTVYARWNTNVTFIGNGGTPVNQQVSQITVGTDIIPGTTFEQITPPTAPALARSGWSFGGWYTTATGGTQLALDSAILPNAEYHARWDATVTFNHNFSGGPGDITRQIRGHIGDVTTPNWPADPTRIGHNFTGWNTEQNGTGTPFTDTTTVQGTTTLYAQWQLRQHTVTFDLNGGDSSTPAPETLDFDSLITEPAPPTHNAHNFIAWNTKKDGSGDDWDFATHRMPDEDFTLYARWDISQYTVTFDLDGGTYAGDQALLSQSIPLGGNGTPLTQLPTRLGFVFDGWNPSLDLSNISENRTFTALWESVTYEVSVITRPGRRVEDVSNNDGSNAPTQPPDELPTILPAPGSTTHRHFVSGYPDGSFRPDSSITRAEVSALLFNLIENDAKLTPILSSAGHFSDVQSASWYFQAISYLASIGVLSGYPDGTFHPNNEMTRAELTTLLSLFFDLTYGDHPFPDIHGHWAYRHIASAFNKDWISGYPDETFRPDNPITRAETVTIINRVINRLPNPATIDHHVTFYRFSDLRRDHWAYYQILEAAIKHEFKHDEDGNEIWVWKESLTP